MNPYRCQYLRVGYTTKHNTTTATTNTTTATVTQKRHKTTSTGGQTEKGKKQKTNHREDRERTPTSPPAQFTLGEYVSERIGSGGCVRPVERLG